MAAPDDLRNELVGISFVSYEAPKIAALTLVAPLNSCQDEIAKSGVHGVVQLILIL